MSFFKKKNQSSKMQKKKINVSVPDLKPKPEIRPVPSPSKRKSESAKKYEDRYPEKEFMKTFSQLTHRHRAWDIWRDFVTMFACSISNAVDKDHYDDREERYMKIIKNTMKRNEICSLNSLPIRSWLWRKTKSKIFWAVFLWR